MLLASTIEQLVFIWLTMLSLVADLALLVPRLLMEDFVLGKGAEEGHFCKVGFVTLFVLLLSHLFFLAWLRVKLRIAWTCLLATNCLEFVVVVTNVDNVIGQGSLSWFIPLHLCFYALL